MRSLLLTPLLFVAGCAVAGVIADKLSSRGAAQYEPPKKPMLVLVERAEDSGMSQDRADRLAMLLQEQLEAAKVAPIIDSAAAVRLRTSMEPRQWQAMTLSQRAAALKADQVLQVTIKQYDSQPVIAGDAKAVILAAVAVYDAAGVRQWPEHPEGHRMSATVPMTRLDAPLEALAGRIASLFYDQD